jgi:hypothetical protein
MLRSSPKIPWLPFSSKDFGGETRRGRTSFTNLRPGINDTERLFAHKLSWRRLGAEGMLLPRPSTSPNYKTGSYWLCVVVVEVAGTSTTEGGVVVVVLVVDLSESQPVTDIRAAAAKQASRNVFISIFLFFGLPFYTRIMAASLAHGY